MKTKVLTNAKDLEEYARRASALIGIRYRPEDLRETRVYGTFDGKRMVAGWILDPGAGLYLSSLDALQLIEFEKEHSRDEAVGINGVWICPSLRSKRARAAAAARLIFSTLGSGRRAIVAGSFHSKVAAIHEFARPRTIFHLPEVRFGEMSTRARIIVVSRPRLALGLIRYLASRLSPRTGGRKARPFQESLRSQERLRRECGRG